jgi:hypothetical protein
VSRWTPAGVAVLILTLAVATVIVVGVIDLANDNPASTEAARWLAGVTGAALGCIATYIGVHTPVDHTDAQGGAMRFRDRDDDEQPSTDDESGQGVPPTQPEPDDDQRRGDDDDGLTGDEDEQQHEPAPTYPQGDDAGTQDQPQVP